MNWMPHKSTEQAQREESGLRRGRERNYGRAMHIAGYPRPANSTLRAEGWDKEKAKPTPKHMRTGLPSLREPLS